MTAAIAYFARESTLSEGAVSIILDRDRNGICLIIAYSLQNGLHEGDQLIFSEALNMLLAKHDLDKEISAITISEFEAPVKSMNGMPGVKSRHALLVYWDRGVWVSVKRAPPFQLA